MDNQHRKIKGYRELNQAELDLMNEIKEEGIRLDELHRKVVSYVAANAGREDISAEADPFRWAAIAKTDLQTGLMALTRAVAAPGFF